MLVLGLAVVLLILGIFWQTNGDFTRLARYNRNRKRILLEDALKYIFDCEYKRVDCNISSLAGHLHITSEKAGSLINRLTTLGLVRLDNGAILLTDEGRANALRVVRIHRIWERYLADETSIGQLDWHQEACKIEHLVSVEDTEKIAAQLGHPVFDPHGDPIPTIQGQLPVQKGTSLATLEKGTLGRIIHLEDEPHNIYEQLVVLGLYPGMQVYVTNVTDKKITFMADGEECSLTPLFASYITVDPLPEETEQKPKYDLLSSLKIGEEAEVMGISPNCRGQQRRRLMDLGIIPGSKVRAVMKSASGNPVGYRVMGTTIGIRKQHAELVFIEKTKTVRDHEHAHEL